MGAEIHQFVEFIAPWPLMLLPFTEKLRMRQSFPAPSSSAVALSLGIAPLATRLPTRESLNFLKPFQLAKAARSPLCSAQRQRLGASISCSPENINFRPLKFKGLGLLKAKFSIRRGPQDCHLPSRRFNCNSPEATPSNFPFIDRGRNRLTLLSGSF